MRFAVMGSRVRRFLLWSVGLFAGALAFGDDHAVQAVRDAGATVSPLGEGWVVEFQRMGKKAGDKEVATVAALGETVLSLNLRETQTTDEGLRYLAALTNLERLHLERTGVGDGGMAHLKGLHRLEYLNLYGTRISDTGLLQLAPLKSLSQLFVWETGVTDRGCEEFARTMPRVKIVRGVDLDLVAAKAEAMKKEKEEVVRKTLEWITEGVEKAPKSNTGDFTTVLITNHRSHPVKLYWVEYGGPLRYYAEIAAGASLLRNTFSNATWVITDEKDIRLGYFISTLEPSQVEIPKL